MIKDSFKTSRFDNDLFLYFFGVLFWYQINCEKIWTKDTYKRIKGEKSIVF